MRIQVQLLLLSEDRRPGQGPANRFIQVLEPCLVYRQEDQ